MLIYIDENQVQRIKCASCGDLVGYTENLIRILEKEVKPRSRRAV